MKLLSTRSRHAARLTKASAPLFGSAMPHSRMRVHASTASFSPGQFNNRVALGVKDEARPRRPLARALENAHIIDSPQAKPAERSGD